jgi:rhodanese-related sulfurtransferase
VVDIRPKQEYADGHIPGSMALEMGDQVGVWAGWLLPHDARIVLIANHDQDVDEAIAQFHRIAMDNVVGVHYGMGDWRAAGKPVATTRTSDVEGFVEAYRAGEVKGLLDVRAPNEQEDGSITGAALRYLPHLEGNLPDSFAKDEPVWVVCGSGYRAMAAVRYLESQGVEAVVVIGGGVPDARLALSA